MFAEGHVEKENILNFSVSKKQAFVIGLKSNSNYGTPETRHTDVS